MAPIERPNFLSAGKNLGRFSFNCGGRDAATPPALLLAAIGGAETELAQLPTQLSLLGCRWSCRPRQPCHGYSQPGKSLESGRLAAWNNGRERGGW